MRTLPAALALAVLAASPAVAEVMTPTQYVKTAGASDLFEVQSSKIVLESTSDPKVRSFAQMMIHDHSESTAKVKAAAMRSGVHAPPPMLTPLQSELVSELHAEHGPARDATYLAQQKAAHNQALTVQKAYAMGGKAPALKSAASQVVPVVEQHIALLKTM